MIFHCLNGPFIGRSSDHTASSERRFAAAVGASRGLPDDARDYFSV